MAELKTQKNDASVEAFLDAIDDPVKREDAQGLSKLMAEVAGAPPTMWGSAIVGFGHRRLKYENGRELDWMLLGFSPRKAEFALYLPASLERLQPIFDRLGKHKTGKGCVYVKRLADVDSGVLRELVEASVRDL